MAGEEQKILFQLAADARLPGAAQPCQGDGAAPIQRFQ